MGPGRGREALWWPRLLAVSMGPHAFSADPPALHAVMDTYIFYSEQSRRALGGWVSRRVKGCRGLGLLTLSSVHCRPEQSQTERLLASCCVIKWYVRYSFSRPSDFNNGTEHMTAAARHYRRKASRRSMLLDTEGSCAVGAEAAAAAAAGVLPRLFGGARPWFSVSLSSSS